MSSGKNAALVIVVLIVVILAGAVIIKKSHRFADTAPAQQAVEVTPSASDSANSVAIAQPVIKVTSDGFTPASVTIKAGTSVTWTNVDNQVHQVNSNPHPTHTDYPPLNTIGTIQPGASKSLSFPTPGVYKFHDHLFPENTGSITVQ